MPAKEIVFTDSEEKEEPTLYEWLVEKVDELFINNIPLESIRELPPTYMYSLGSIAYTLSIFCLIWFSVAGDVL